MPERLRARLLCGAPRRLGALALVACMLAAFAAGCRPTTEGPIDFDSSDTVTAADASATAVPTASSPAPTATSQVPAATVTPTASVTPGVTQTVTPSPGVTRDVTPAVTPSLTVTPGVTQTVTPTATVTRDVTPTVTPSLTVTPAVTPSPSVTPGVTPSVTPTATAAASVTPGVTPSPSVTRTVTPTLPAIATPVAAPIAVAPILPPAIDYVPPAAGSLPTPSLPSGPPGPNTLVYQGFWSAAPHADITQNGWHSAPSWYASGGLLRNDGGEPGPMFAAPYMPMYGYMPPVLTNLNYAIEAEMAYDSTATRGAFGVYLRAGSGLPVAAPINPDDFGMWRAGLVANARAFIIGEQRVQGGQTPADLLLAKAVDATDFSPGEGWVRYRFEARNDRYTLYADGKKLLEVQDARYLAGTEIGVWTDHAAVKVRDFRLYTLPE